MKWYRLLMLTVVVLGLVACGTSSDTTSGSGANGSAPSESSTDDTANGGSTSAGNPILIDISGAKAFAVTTETPTNSTSNLKKVTSSGMQEVLAFDTSASLSTAKALDVEALPKVEHMDQGPLGELVVGFGSQVTIDGNFCRMIRVPAPTEDTLSPLCLESNQSAYEISRSSAFNGKYAYQLPAMRERVQFDEFGNIFYIIFNGEDASGTSLPRLIKWHITSHTSEVLEIADDSVGIRDFHVISNQLIFFKEDMKEEPEAIATKSRFGLITNGSTTLLSFGGFNFFVDGMGQYIYAPLSFNFADAAQSGMHQIAYDDSGLGETTILFNWLALTDAEGKTHDINASYIGYFERTEAGQILGMTTTAQIVDEENFFSGKSCGTEIECTTTGFIVNIFPGEPSIIDTPVQHISYFKEMDGNLFMSGQYADGTHAFVRMPNGDKAAAVNFFGGEDLQLLHFIKINDVIYFDARRVIDDTVFFGTLDLSKGAPYAYEELSALQAELLDLKAAF